MSRYIENIDEIEKQLDCESVLHEISHQPEKKALKSGKEIRYPCPVHKGDGHNLAINIETLEWFCHSKGCKGKGLIDLHAKATGTKINESAQKLATKFGLPIKFKKTSPQNEGYKPEDVQKAWKEAKTSGQDVYFASKGLKPPPGVKFGKNPKGYVSVLVPMKDVEGLLQGITAISSKRKIIFKIGGIKGAFFQFGDILRTKLALVGEGVATVQTAWEAYQREIPAISCGSHNNTFDVVKAIKEKYPDLKLIFLIDCDSGGKGEQAALKIASQFPDVTFRKPSFEAFVNSGYENLTDFNDLISKCEQTLEEVLRQLEIEYVLPRETPKENVLENPVKEPKAEDFYQKLGKLIGEESFSTYIKNRNYESFEKEHKRLFAAGGLITGHEKIDEQLYFSKGDLVIVQAMSNHGKSTFMLQLAYKFLSEEENKDKNPMCVFITYESLPLRIEEKLLNIIGHETQEGTMLLYTRKGESKYLYPDKKDFQTTISTYNELQKQNRIHVLKRTSLENIGKMIDIYKQEYPERTLIFFLDYLQIMDTKLKQDGWERVKAIAYELEKQAIEKEVIIFAACQVNENRQTREGRDIYNAATTVIDIFNHSHASLKSNKDQAAQYKEQVQRKNVCTFSVFKQKHGSSFDLPDYFLFNGYYFEEKRNVTPELKASWKEKFNNDPDLDLYD